MTDNTPTYYLVPLRPLPVDGGSTYLEADPAAEWVDLRDEDGGGPLSIGQAIFASARWALYAGLGEIRDSRAFAQLACVVPLPTSDPAMGLVMPLAVCEAKRGGLVWGIWRAGVKKDEETTK